MSQTIYVSGDRDIRNPNSLTFEEREAELEAMEISAEKKRKREQGSIYPRWTQFNLEHTNDLIQLAIKYPRAHAILYFLVDQMDEQNAVMCSSQVIEELLGVSRQTVSKNIKILKDTGFISVYKSGNSNVYAINDAVYWKTFGNRIKYSKFPANIILSINEQDAECRQRIEAEAKEVESVRNA